MASSSAAACGSQHQNTARPSWADLLGPSLPPRVARGQPKSYAAQMRAAMRPVRADAGALVSRRQMRRALARRDADAATAVAALSARLARVEAELRGVR